MSRSGYSEDYEHIALYRTAVERAIQGKRGQAFLREMAAALDAMPVKELITGEIVTTDGAACAIGSVALARHMDVSGLDDTDPGAVADRFGVAQSLVREIAYENDEGNYRSETPAERWSRMRKWVDEHLQKARP